MNTGDILEFLISSSARWTSRGHLHIEHNFEIKPQDFLSYAEADLANDYSHRLINSLSNAKRALDCQVDILLIGFGYYEISKKKKWGFPKKIEIIKVLGIIAPRVLLKINRVRNLMEHEFSNPTNEQVEDFVDIVSLFIASTDRFIYDYPEDMEIENDENVKLWIQFDADYKNNNINIKTRSKEDENEEFIVNVEHENYAELLRQILRISMLY